MGFLSRLKDIGGRTLGFRSAWQASPTNPCSARLCLWDAPRRPPSQELTSHYIERLNIGCGAERKCKQHFYAGLSGVSPLCTRPQRGAVAPAGAPRSTAESGLAAHATGGLPRFYLRSCTLGATSSISKRRERCISAWSSGSWVMASRCPKPPTSSWSWRILSAHSWGSPTIQTCSIM